MSNIKTFHIIFARNIHYCEKWKYIVGLLCIFKFMQCNIENTVTIICLSGTSYTLLCKDND